MRGSAANASLSNASRRSGNSHSARTPPLSRCRRHVCRSSGARDAERRAGEQRDVDAAGDRAPTDTGSLPRRRRAPPPPGPGSCCSRSDRVQRARSRSNGARGEVEAGAGVKAHLEGGVLDRVGRPRRRRRVGEEQQPGERHLGDRRRHRLRRVEHARREPGAAEPRSARIRRAVAERRGQQVVQVAAFRRDGRLALLEQLVRAAPARRACRRSSASTRHAAPRRRASSGRRAAAPQTRARRASR